MRNNSAGLVCGVLFLTGTSVLSAQTFKVIRNFGYGAFPFGKLLVSSNTVYGINGGSSDYGSIFRIKLDGTGYTNLKTFSQTYLSTNGFYTNSDGATPLAGLVLGGDTLYGTCYQGGAFGKGTVFSLKTGGISFTVLRHFAGIDGKAPYAELLLSGNVLYGTTAAGGISNKGTVFRLNTDGSDFAVLKNFAISDGLLPLGSLALANDTLYGTTLQGGAWNHGTVFSIHTDGTGFAVLKEFTGADGSQPRFNLILSGDSLYGTTEGDGDLSNSLVFKVNTDGTDFRILKTFSTPDPVAGTNDDGFYVRSELALSGGTLFGTTSWAGDFASGVIFALRTDGSAYTVLRHFSAVNNNGANSDGATPLPALTLSGDTLYGTTQYGGSAGQGTLFSLNIAPQIQINDSRFGVSTNGFGFNATGYSNQILVVEACADLAIASWLPLDTNTVATGPIYFLDPNWTNYPRRFYRVRME